jgi:hypothetical protein
VHNSGDSEDQEYLFFNYLEQIFAANGSVKGRYHVGLSKYRQANLLLILAFSRDGLPKYHVPQCDDPKEVLIAI